MSEALGPLGTACRLYLGTKASFFAPNWVEISLLEIKKFRWYTGVLNPLPNKLGGRFGGS